MRENGWNLERDNEVVVLSQGKNVRFSHLRGEFGVIYSLI